MNFTEQQKKAIYSRDKNLLVAAAAGSGKTAVLVERISQLILEEKCGVDEMLIVTFTNAAAQEMRTRIYSAIEKKISEETDADLISKLERQAILLNGSFIMTFHAFCLSVIKRNFSKIDLDPKFREADERELNILKQEIIEEHFEEKYSSDENFLKFSDEFGGNVHGDDNLYKIILELHNAACSRPYPEQWLNSLAENYEQPKKILFEKKTWIDFLFDSALDEANNIIENDFENCQKCLDESYRLEKIAPKFDGVKEKFTLDFDFIKRLHDAKNDWDKIFEIVDGEISFSKFSSKKIPDDLKPNKENLKKIRDEYKDKI